MIENVSVKNMFIYWDLLRDMGRDKWERLRYIEKIGWNIVEFYKKISLHNTLYNSQKTV